MTKIEARQIIKAFNLDYGYSPTGNTLFVQKLLDSGLTEEQIAVTLVAIGETCNYCWNSSTRCHCKNDE